MGCSVTQQQMMGIRFPIHRWLVSGLAAAGLVSCSLLPSELNLSPLYRHRLDADGNVAELDALWPIFHYEVTDSGGADFRIRPFYRYVKEDQPTIDWPRARSEQQFLWPLGDTIDDGEEYYSRVFPLWRYRERPNDQGLRETDWYFLFPFVWGGSSEDGEENYFGVLPFYADFPDFLTYKRFRAILWPLYLGLEKDERVTHMFLWPLGGYGYGPGNSFWHRFLPLYSYAVDPRYRRYSLLWPIINWGQENLDGDDPLSRFFFWPLYGQLNSKSISAWTFLWPFFQKFAIKDRLFRLDILWPIFRYMDDRTESAPLYQWWIWQLVARTISDRQWAWNFLWPLIWIREYHDPKGSETQRWFLPLYWQIDRKKDDGSEDHHRRIWPFYSRTVDENGRGEWRTLSLWPWRLGNARGAMEAYSWLWTLAEGRSHGEDDESFHLAANLYTSRDRGGRKQSSVPFLFNYEDDRGSVLRLFQFIPIHFATKSKEPSEGG